MNYKKIRLILIILLIFVNLFLYGAYLYTKVNDENIINQMSMDKINILSDREITIDEEFLDIDLSKLKNFEYSKMNREIMLKILENPEEHANNMFFSQNATGKIDNDGSFSILINESIPKYEIEDLLTNAGFDLTNSMVTLDGTSTKYTYILDGYEVSNLSFGVILNDRSTSILGNFAFDEQSSTLLTEDIDIFSLILRMGEDAKGEISGVTISYKASFGNDITSNILFSPVISFIYDDYAIDYDIMSDSYEKNVNKS